MSANQDRQSLLQSYLRWLEQDLITAGANPPWDLGVVAALDVASMTIMRTTEPDQIDEAFATKCPEQNEPAFLGYIVAEARIAGFARGLAATETAPRLEPSAKGQQTPRSSTPDDIDVPDTRATEIGHNLPPSLELITNPRRRYSDLIGLEQAKEDMALNIRLIHDQAYVKRTKLPPDRGIILFGPPGNGKTAFAEATAAEFAIPFLQVRSSELVNQYAGNSEKAIHEVFVFARKKAPCILFFDEADTLLPRRDDVQGITYMKSVVTQFLQEMGGMSKDSDSQVIVLAATNRLEDMDAAAIRSGRFDTKIEIPAPNENGRTKMLTLFLDERPLGNKVDLAAWARNTEGWSAAELESLVKKAVKGAIKLDPDALGPLVITNVHLKTAWDEIESAKKAQKRTNR